MLGGDGYGAVTNEKVQAIIKYRDDRKEEPKDVPRHKWVSLEGMERLQEHSLKPIHVTARNYLLQRGFPPIWVIGSYCPFVGVTGEQADRLVMPHWKDSDIVFYQGRLLYDDLDRPKYKNTPTDKCIFTRKQLVWNENRLKNQIEQL